MKNEFKFDSDGRVSITIKGLGKKLREDLAGLEEWFWSAYPFLREGRYLIAILRISADAVYFHVSEESKQQAGAGQAGAAAPEQPNPQMDPNVLARAVRIRAGLMQLEPYAGAPLKYLEIGRAECLKLLDELTEMRKQHPWILTSYPHAEALCRDRLDLFERLIGEAN